MRNLLIFISTFLIIVSCRSFNEVDYKIDKVIVLNSSCRQIRGNDRDSGSSNCPNIAVSIERNLKYFCTKGIAKSSKLECYEGLINFEIWDTIYNNYVKTLLNDTNIFDHKQYNDGIVKDSKIDIYDGTETFILLYSNNKILKAFRIRDNETGYYRDVFNSIISIENKIKTDKMKDTTLIDMYDNLMPPMPEKSLIKLRN